MFTKPQPNDIVTVTVQRRSNLLNVEFDTNTYENVRVIESAKWEHTTDFRIEDPTSIISSNRVLTLNSVTDLIINGDPAEQVKGSYLCSVKIKGSKGATYTVDIENGIGVKCDCVGFQYRRKCRHLEEAQKNVDLNTKI